MAMVFFLGFVLAIKPARRSTYRSMVSLDATDRQGVPVEIGSVRFSVFALA
jgi:hypothetical protein